MSAAERLRRLLAVLREEEDEDRRVFPLPRRVVIAASPPATAQIRPFLWVAT